MCDKCQELDKKVERYRLIMARMIDPQVVQGIGRLIEDAEAQKLALHPEQKK